VKKVTVTQLDDKQWFGLTDDGDFILLEEVPENTLPGDIIYLEESKQQPYSQNHNVVPIKKRERSHFRKIAPYAAAIALMIFLSSFITFLTPNAEASSITFYGEKEWTITIQPDGTLIDEMNNVTFESANTGYWTERLREIGTDQNKIWVGIANEEENHHVEGFLSIVESQLEEHEINLYSFSFQTKWWELKTEKNLTMKELASLYLEEEYGIVNDMDNIELWEEELKRRQRLSN
jgi:hypothetical protein